jgi:hypothetical protein
VAETSNSSRRARSLASSATRTKTNSSNRGETREELFAANAERCAGEGEECAKSKAQSHGSTDASPDIAGVALSICSGKVSNEDRDNERGF